ncbi:MAG: SRPBCC domain-containing protein [Armatimonadota bacterium]|nr:SRPBCC domain-containing protein [bacterium]
MREVCTEIEIKGSPKRVWKTLTSFYNYPMWNPFMRVTGELKRGARIEISILQPGKKSIIFNPKLTRIEPNQELRWVDRPRIPLIFESERIITIEHIDSRTVRLVQRQRYKGALSLISRKLAEGMKLLMEAMNIAVKAHVERG